MPALIFPGDLFSSTHPPFIVNKLTAFSEELSTDIGITESSIYDFIVVGLSDLATQDGLGSRLTSEADPIQTITALLETDIRITSFVVAVFQEVLSTTISASTSVDYNMYFLMKVVTSLVASGTADSYWQALAQVTTALTTLTYLNRGFEEDLSTTLGVTISVDEIVAFYVELETLLSATATSERNMVVLRSMTTSINLSESADVNLRLLAEAETDLALAGVIVIDDTEYLALSINIVNRAVSEYDQFPFNSFTKFKNEYLGATSDGIYRMSGDDDAGETVTAKIRTGLLQLGSIQKKVVPECYIGYTSTGSLVMKIAAVEQGSKNEHWFELDRTKDSTDTDNFTLPRGLKGRYFQFELIDMDGADFELDSIDLYPVVLSRRIR